MIKTAVQNELLLRGWTRYRAAVEFREIVSQPHFYDWMNGKYNLSDDKASAILERLSLTVRAASPQDPADGSDFGSTQSPL